MDLVLLVSILDGSGVESVEGKFEVTAENDWKLKKELRWWHSLDPST
jgi:hypothetical protein